MGLSHEGKGIMKPNRRLRLDSSHLLNMSSEVCKEVVLSGKSVKGTACNCSHVGVFDLLSL